MPLPIGFKNRCSANNTHNAVPISEQKSLLVLVAEGDAALRRGIELFLVSEGHYVMSAATINEASELLRENDFDLLVSNVDLPDGSGFELLATARKIQPIHAVAIAAASRASLHPAARECGFGGMLVLPFELNLLANAIAALPLE